MKTYEYKAVNSNGQVVAGEMTASSKAEVMDALYSKDLIPVKIEERKRARRTFRIKLFSSRIPSREILTFYQSLSVLLMAGVPMDKALSICREIAEAHAFKIVLDDVLSEIKGGLSLSDALSKYPRLFSQLYTNMIRAGESAGMLPQTLERIYEHMKKSQEMKENIISSITYPIFLIAVGIISIAILVTYVVPRFYVVFSSMGTTPPFPLPQLSWLGSTVRDNGPYIAAVFALLTFFLYRWLKRPEGKEKAYKIALGLPLIGRIMVKIENVKFSYNLGMLLKNGVPILKAVNIVKEMFNNPLYRREVEEIYRQLREGTKLSATLAVSRGLWHPVVVGMCEVGEESGNLGDMLVKASEALERDVESSLKRAVSLIEPATILAMGLIVGSIVVSMISAIFSVNEIVR